MVRLKLRIIGQCVLFCLAFALTLPQAAQKLSLTPIAPAFVVDTAYAAATTEKPATAAAQTPSATAGPPKTAKPAAQAAAYSPVHYQDVTTVANPSDIAVLVNQFYILPEDYEPGDLERIDSRFSSGRQYLRHEARVAFEAFAQAVRKSTGQTIRAVSAYRNFDRQDTVYLKYKKSGVTLEEYSQTRDTVSARPGHSEHQLGLAVDVIRCSESVVQTKAYAWYKDHAHEYGFIIRYPEGREEVTGYQFEPWHLRYLGVELATAVYNSGLTYDEYCAVHVR